MTKAEYPLIVLMPVFEDRESAAKLIKDLVRDCPCPPYIIAVDDGSVREPTPISCIADAGLSGEVLYLARNMGHQRAIATGIAYIQINFTAGAIVVMDSDGEDDPKAIPPLLEKLAEPDVDAVVATRRKRSESWSFRTFYIFYRTLFYLLTGSTIRFGNFSALSDHAVRRLAAMQETWVHFAASLMVSRLRISAVDTDRGERYAGKSQMNFVALALHGFRSLMVFAEQILVRLGISCALLVVLIVVLLLATIVLKVIGLATPGFFPIASGILIVMMLQAGILVFVTLMITGVIRSAGPMTHAQLDILIDRIEKTSAGHEQAASSPARVNQVASLR